MEKWWRSGGGVVEEWWRSGGDNNNVTSHPSLPWSDNKKQTFVRKNSERGKNKGRKE